MSPKDAKSLLAYSPMFHARHFAGIAKFRSRHFQPMRFPLESIPEYGSPNVASDIYLDGRPDLDRPLMVQFCANKPEELLQAAKYVQPFCDAVDLNLGCPQGIAKKGHYGAFLQEDWDIVYDMISELDKNLDIPVTAKIRVLETKEKTLAYAKKILAAGASILAVHARQRDQKGHKTGLADWSLIRYLRENLPPETVLFANGNILRHEDIDRCLDATGADGVMSAEGNLYDPTIFAGRPSTLKNDRAYWQGRDGRGGYRMDFVFRRYMSIIYKYVLEIAEPKRKPLFSISDPARETPDSGDDFADEPPPNKRQKQGHGKSTKSEKSMDPNLVALQAHLFRLLRPLVAVHTEVRDALARSRAGDIAAFENVLNLTERAVREGLLDYQANPDKYEDTQDNSNEADTEEQNITDHESSLRAIRACKRPWWVCQPYVRPLPQEAMEKGSITLSKKERKILAEEEASASKLRSETNAQSVRQEQDVKDGLEQGETAAPAMICG